MNAITAAFQVLLQSREPLSKQEIAKRAVESGIWTTSGKTPYETIGSQIYTDIKKNGEYSRFLLIKPGVFAINEKVVAEYNANQASEQPQPQPQPQPQAQPQPEMTKEPTKTETADSSCADVTQEQPSLADCAFTILTHFADRKPLSADAIAAIAKDNELITSDSLDLGSDIFAELAAENRLNARNRIPQRFILCANRLVALQAWLDEQEETTIQYDEIPDNAPADVNADVAPDSLADIAQAILEEAANGKPLHYRTITAKASESGRLVSNSKTPAVSLYAEIITEIKQRTRKGEQQRFLRFKNGYVGLAKWNDNAIAYQLQKHNQAVQDEAIKRLRQLNNDAFEAFLTRFLAEAGFENITLQYDRDNDAFNATATLVSANVVKLPVVIRILKYLKTVDVNTVKDFQATIPANHQGILITTSDFSEAALAAAPALAFMNAAQIANLMVEYAVGIKKTPTVYCELDNDELPEN